MELHANNLDSAQSPYLRQHADNPVWWQEWRQEVLDYARSAGKLLFVSVGYSTCHWCHVMAHDTFSDPECADYLNEHFVSIKVDREERPDIDQFLMDFLVAATGQGGWPLNVVLTPDLRPFFGITYLGSQARFGRPGFREVMEKVRAFWKEKDGEITAFTPEYRRPGSPGEEGETADAILPKIQAGIRSRYDDAHGGFGTEQKFPPHATLLYMLQAGADPQTGSFEAELRGSLDAICRGGLHDHLQGGFFRYCTDRQWRIPHFEKMLYDQAMLLWSLSQAAARFEVPAYRHAAMGVLRALRESFRTHEGLFISAHDADTDGTEGGSYLWTPDELRELLSTEEHAAVSRHFEISEEGNFEGSIHLLRRSLPGEESHAEAEILQAAREKLLTSRKGRPQPGEDRKIITSWNALAGVSLVQAWRYLGDRQALTEAQEVFAALWGRHRRNGTIVHSSLAGETTQHSFLQDAAALMLLASYLHEESRDYREQMDTLAELVMSFRDGETWLEGRSSDFVTIPAGYFDSPIPASSSLAELALLRRDMLTGELYDELSFGAPLIQDFHNLAALTAGGYVYLIESPERIAWDSLPLHVIQAPGEHTTYCYKGLCTPGLP